MVIPSVMMIEIAIDTFQEIPQDMREKQLRELHTLGDIRAQEFGASGLSNDFELGYELGLQTARTMLMMNVKAVQAQVTL